MSMTVVDLKSEITKRYTDAKAIEDKYPGGLTAEANHEDYEQVKTILLDLDALELQLLPLEAAEARKARISENVDKYLRPATPHRHPGDFNPNEWPDQIKDAGWQFIESPEYKRLSESGAFNNPRAKFDFHVPLTPGTKGATIGELGQKALVHSGTGVGGPLIMPQQIPGFMEILQHELNLLDMIPRSGTSSDTIEFVREKTFTNNAAFVAEATATTGTSGTKPESLIDFEPDSERVRTLAHWIPVTNKMLADAPQTRGIINQRLLLGLDLKLEAQIIDGDGAGENLLGILRQVGILIESAGSSNNVADAIFKARTQIMVTGLARPNAVVMHPNDWQAIRLMRENVASGTLGGYMYGPPSVAGPVTLWGYPVVESLGAIENTALIGDFNQGVTLYDREAAAIRVGLIDDQFIRNMQTILAELRVAMAVWRPTAFCKVTGV